MSAAEIPSRSSIGVACKTGRMLAKQTTTFSKFRGRERIIKTLGDEASADLKRNFSPAGV